MKLIHSFKYAIDGIHLASKDRNMKVHLLATGVVILLGFFFSLSFTEWALLFLCIGFVLSAELFNTSIEKLCDCIVLLNKDAYEKMGAPKDLAAGAVLVVSIASAIIGTLIFVPHFLKFI